MAIYPCDHHGLRYQGAQQTIYPAIVAGTSSRRAKQRLCPACFTEATAWIEAHLADATREDLPDGCCLCGADAADVAIFVTVYGKGQERADWFAHACQGCADLGATVALFGAGAGA